MVRLTGKPEEVGGILGEILGSFVRSRVDGFRREGQSKGRKSREELAACLKLLEDETPHWIEESRALAQNAGVDFMDLLEVNFAAPLTTQPSCTSVIVLGDRSERGHPLLLKIRDERPQHQAMGYRRLDGTAGMLFGMDACNMGVGQGCNEFGLAVANNSGGLVPESAFPPGLNDCHVTRILLERARNVDEALDVFAALLESGKVGLVDGVRGMIFLLADRLGKGLVIETTRDKYEILKMKTGVAVWSNHWLLKGSERFTRPIDPDHPLARSSLARLERGRELLDGKEKISTRDLEAFSRDEANPPYSICNGSDTFPWRTVSAFSYELDPALRIPVRVAPGLPSRVAFRDVSLWAEETPPDYLLEWTG
jgi:hypothetical protein